MYLKKAKAWADAYYKSPRHEYVMAFMVCHLHGCQTCFALSTMDTHLNKYMGDLYRETMRWIARVTNSGLHDNSHVGMRMGQSCQKEPATLRNT